MRIADFLKPSIKLGYKILVLACILIIIPSIINFQNPIHYNFHNKYENIKSSGTWATLDLINPVGINNTRFTHDDLIVIQGRLYNRIPPEEGKSGYTVAIEVDDLVDSSYNDVTDINGYFQINYYVDPSLDIYSSHKIEATVIDSTPDNVEYRTHYIIYVNTTSYFDANVPVSAKLIGEFFDFDFDDYLKYYDGTGIPFSSINYYWYNGPVVVDSNFVSTDVAGLIQPIFIPDIGITSLELLLTYTSPPDVGYSETLYTTTKLFSNISCIWDLPSTIRASSNLRIAGQLISRNNPSLSIDNRDINIFYNGTIIGTTRTNSNGDFSIIHALPQWVGQTIISIRLPNPLGKNIVTRRFVTVQQPSTPTGSGPQAPPFLMFFSIFLPILGVVIGGLAFYGYRYYKKQDKLSKVVNLPLEDKIVNLKILKESGRLEESLSYLFNAIYMDLVGAKFGRIRKGNETIRDFAIVSVKNLRLSPATVYPFIQKVEEIIYAKPFQITDREFYSTINLFSPIYFELTVYNFEFNF
ncbi:MAG: hypothetical protein ACFE96_04945 [Candidatus Hermodarchaeota archaeon]